MAARGATSYPTLTLTAAELADGISVAQALFTRSGLAASGNRRPSDLIAEGGAFGMTTHR